MARLGRALRTRKAAVLARIAAIGGTAAAIGAVVGTATNWPEGVVAGLTAVVAFDCLAPPVNATEQAQHEDKT